MKYVILKNLGVLSEHTDGNGNPMTKEANLISWDGKAPVIDIRSWSENHETMTHGTTLTQPELHALIESIKAWSKSEKERK